jgi:hypothetical protein
MSKADSRAPARHAADSHDVIRVQGARVNNLKDVGGVPSRHVDPDLENPRAAADVIARFLQTHLE